MVAGVSGELEHIWSRVQAERARAVDESTYRIWLAPLTPRELHAGCLLIEAPADACAWVCNRFGRLVQASATIVLGADTLVEFVARTGLHAGGAAHASTAPAVRLHGAGAPPQRRERAGGESQTERPRVPRANP